MLFTACIVLVCVLTTNSRAITECDPGLVAVHVSKEGYRCELAAVVVQRTDTAAKSEYTDNILSDQLSDQLVLGEMSRDEEEMVADTGNSYKQKKEALRTVIEDAEDEIEVLEERLDDLRDNLTELISHAPYASPTTKLPTHSTESTSEFASSESTSESASSTSGPSSAAPENMAESTSEPFTTPYFNEASMNATTAGSVQELKIQGALEDNAVVSPSLNAEDCEKITIADPKYNEINGHFESEFKCYGNGYVFTDIKLLDSGGFMGRCCKTP